MEALKAWVENLVLLVVVATLMEMILPDGAPRKFVRLVLGLVVILAIVQPVGMLLRHGDWFDQFNPDLVQLGHTQAQPADDWRLEAAQVRAAGEEAVRADMSERFGREVGALLLLVPGVLDASVDAQLDADGHVQKLQAQVTSEEADAVDVEARVAAFLDHAYDVSPSRVYVDVRPVSGKDGDHGVGGAPK